MRTTAVRQRAAAKGLPMLFQPGTPLILTGVAAAFPDRRSLIAELEPVTGTADLLLTMGFRSASWPGTSAKGEISGSASARLGQVQGGSRRMRPPKFLPTGHGGGTHVLPRFRPARSLFDTHCR
jgi:hypothetical protein